MLKKQGPVFNQEQKESNHRYEPHGKPGISDLLLGSVKKSTNQDCQPGFLLSPPGFLPKCSRTAPELNFLTNGREMLPEIAPEGK